MRFSVEDIILILTRGSKLMHFALLQRTPGPDFLHIVGIVFSRVWWKLMPGVIITVKWPSGEIRVKQEECDIWDYVRSADPNDFYRAHLEECVGKQHWSWDWRLPPGGNILDNQLQIKFRKGKETEATYCALKWA